MVELQQECAAESPDNPQFQEASVSGHIMLLTLKEGMEGVLSNLKKYAVH